MDAPVFQERLLHAPDTCSNCFGFVREKRRTIPLDQQKRDRAYPTAEYARDKRTTSVEHVPTDSPTRSHMIFCDCGSSSAYDRHRSEIVGKERFRELLKTAIQTIESKGVSLSREHAVRRALKLGCPTEARFPAVSADRAIAVGIEYGVEMVLIKSQSSPSHAAAD